MTWWFAARLLVITNSSGGPEACEHGSADRIGLDSPADPAAACRAYAPAAGR
jgi:hypothetical protein